MIKYILLVVLLVAIMKKMMMTKMMTTMTDNKAILSPQFCILWRSHGSLVLIVSIDVGVICTHTHKLKGS